MECSYLLKDKVNSGLQVPALSKVKALQQMSWPIISDKINPKKSFVFRLLFHKAVRWHTLKEIITGFYEVFNESTGWSQIKNPAMSTFIGRSSWLYQKLIEKQHYWFAVAARTKKTFKWMVRKDIENFKPQAFLGYHDIMTLAPRAVWNNQISGNFG